MKFFKNYLNNKVKSLLDKYNFKSKMLEIGCGTGETMELLKDSGYNIEGIDLSQEAVKQCKAKRLSAKKQDFLGNKKKYNSIICIDVLEHIKDDSKFIKHIYESLKKQGKAFILVPSGKMMKDDIKYGHYRRYSKKQLIKKLKQGGFKIEYVEMFGYPFLYYLRIFANYLTPIKIKEKEDLKKSTEKSSYESVFDDSALSKIADFLNKSNIFLKMLLLQNLFSKGKKGLGVIIIVNKT